MFYLHMFSSSIDFQVMLDQTNNVLQIIWSAPKNITEKVLLYHAILGQISWLEANTQLFKTSTLPHINF